MPQKLAWVLPFALSTILHLWHLWVGGDSFSSPFQQHASLTFQSPLLLTVQHSFIIYSLIHSFGPRLHARLVLGPEQGTKETKFFIEPTFLFGESDNE